MQTTRVDHIEDKSALGVLPHSDISPASHPHAPAIPAVVTSTGVKGSHIRTFLGDQVPGKQHICIGVILYHLEATPLQLRCQRCVDPVYLHIGEYGLRCHGTLDRLDSDCADSGKINIRIKIHGSRGSAAASKAALTPDQVFDLLKQGNKRFLSGTITSRDHSALVRSAAEGQFPKAIILSCLDSRIPVEDVCDRGIGDIFVARVAGNFENTDILGSMEFATAVAGAKLVLVMGHSDCGAIKAAIDGAELGNITAMLENIQPAIDSLASYDGDKTSANHEFIHMVTQRNVQLTIEDIRKRSQVVADLEKKGQVKIVGALYDMTSGTVSFID